MKSVLQAMFRLTMAMGNLLDVIIIICDGYFIERQSMEFLFFAALMLTDMLILALLARKYSYKEGNSETE